MKEHISSDLLALKSFLLSGMKVTVTEEKVMYTVFHYAAPYYPDY